LSKYSTPKSYILHKLDYIELKLHNSYNLLRGASNKLLALQENFLKLNSQLLDSLDYRKTLNRGFCIVKNGEGKIISSKSEAAKSGEINITFSDGVLTLYPN
jgi:exonuclease VII large subunit